MSNVRTAHFRTRARTVDHLGREQIADTPTAISELWKNAYDAYARTVSLEIYDGAPPVAVLVDDGHGMNLDEFVERWLTVGTESKMTGGSTPIEDRNGLRLRPKQGQKGIGRLSCAKLAPTLLLVSKRREGRFVTGLVDWRLFENPFLNFEDIAIPHFEFDEPEELFGQLGEMARTLISNVTGGDDETRQARVRDAWRRYDEIHAEDVREDRSGRVVAPSAEILSDLKMTHFEPRHLVEWLAWNGAASHGTALLFGRINFDLVAQLRSTPDSPVVKNTRHRLFETLSSFVDPFVDTAIDLGHNLRPDFSYRVRAWNDGVPEVVVGSEKQFDRRMLDGLEHILEGSVAGDGTFTGRVKAFGAWQAYNVVVPPPPDVRLSTRADVRVGPFHFFAATMEVNRENSTMPPMEHKRYEELAKQYAGFMMFRDGLRIMPYGREDTDFFRIDFRRTLNAGREFWSHRRMFGRVGLSRDLNPNLRDKAGREGLVDNEATKNLRQIVENILRQSARSFFGSDSDIRQTILPEVQAKNRKERAEEERRKLRKRQRETFRAKLKTNAKALPALVRDIDRFAEAIAIQDEEDVAEAQRKVAEYAERLSDLKIPGAPKELGSQADAYATFRQTYQSARATLTDVNNRLEQAVEQLNPADPRDILERQGARIAAQVWARILKWRREIEGLQKNEFKRVRELVAERNKGVQNDITTILERFDGGEVTFPEASRLIEALREHHSDSNSEVFGPYIAALENLRESIDLEHLASFGLEEVSELRSDIDRLNALAQLGIAVEITGHELQAFDDIIGAGLRALPDELQETRAVKDITLGYEGLTDQLRILTPLRLAGRKVERWVTGSEIATYVADFFKIQFVRARIELEATTAFRNTRVFDQPSRLLPVFINLLNNSAYWLAMSDHRRRRIILDVIGTEVIVSDNGPGVQPGDVSNLFKLFFTRKSEGGRGVGLYLCKSNLAAGGHRIRYAENAEGMPLPGANFLIEFKGAVFNGG